MSKNIYMFDVVSPKYPPKTLKLKKHKPRSGEPSSSQRGFSPKTTSTGVFCNENSLQDTSLCSKHFCTLYSVGVISRHQKCLEQVC